MGGYIDDDGNAHIEITGGPDSDHGQGGQGLEFGGGDGNNRGRGDGSGGDSDINKRVSIPGYPNVIFGRVHSLGTLTLDDRIYYARPTLDSVMSVFVDKQDQITAYTEVVMPKDYFNPSWAARRDISRDFVQEAVNDERSFLLDASAIIVDAGEKVSSHIGNQYKDYAEQVANNFRSFQGKDIRSQSDAMASLNALMDNPSMKVKAADVPALVNALKSINANDLASRFAHIGKFFKVADLAIKVDKIREKSIEGYQTGNWGPLMYETEAMVLSGITGTMAIGLVTAVLSAFAPPVFAATALSIVAFVAIAYATSFIDAEFAERFNNAVIRPAN
ncbi:colicin-like pore-forming protein [Serratia rubidaea]|uniref:colicin-like pore-forming protein n=1 Tax=Serratia rubidaea TaxID=61652 RepID=UPI002DB9353F|nr:colicin-like pore-forming protein [Serratia rubidaea]MEB7587809.1 colicin-like pore-forming protein [Serratia rubidaea]